MSPSEREPDNDDKNILMGLTKLMQTYVMLWVSQFLVHINSCDNVFSLSCLHSYVLIGCQCESVA